MNNIKSGLLLLILFLLAGRNTSTGQTVKALKLGTYFQDEKTDIPLPEQAGKNVIRLFNVQGIHTAVTSNGVFKYQSGKWSGNAFGSDWRTATTDSKGGVWLASVRTIQKAGYSKMIELPDQFKNDTILCLNWENDNLLQVGTTSGILSYDGNWNAIPFAKGKRVNAMATDKRGDLWVATTSGLLRRMSGSWINLDIDLMAAGLKHYYLSLESRTDNDEMIFGGLFAVGCIAQNGDNWILRGADGLPYGPITSIHTTDKTMWFGTAMGAIKKDKTWHYYCGKRWIPDNKVNDILPLDEHSAWIATPEGISQIQEVAMTLDQKAAAFEERIKKRHNRHGLVADSRLLKQGDLSTSVAHTTDNDGLWTSIYLASECFRYAVTKDPEAKQNAIKAYEAMERLETTTGIPGFPARSVVAADESTGKGGEWHLSADGKWKWKGDTSSDELVGHMLAYPLFYDLVAEGKMKDRVKNLVHRIMSHIVDHNFQLIDLDGKPTRWAVWTPDSLNFKPNWWYERGINSLQILAFLKAASHVTGDPKFEKAYQELVQKHHYVENMVQQKMYGPYDINHSDTELAFLPYYTLFRYASDSRELPSYLKSMQRSWNVEKADSIPIWNIIASTALKKDCDLHTALNQLHQIPMDMVSWTMTNSQRWDLPKDQLDDRFGKAQAIRPIPTPERAVSKWNNNNFRYDGGDDGYSEDDGAYFLLPYWMGRYYNYWVK